MVGYRVAEAGEADLAHLERLRLEWSEADGLAPTDDFGSRMRDWWERQAGMRRAWLVFDQTGAPIAMANALVFERMPRPGEPTAHWAYVGNVWVGVEHRRRGVGTQLMRHVLDWARAEGMERIVLNPSEMSLPLYRGLGFRPADDLMRLDL